MCVSLTSVRWSEVKGGISIFNVAALLLLCCYILNLQTTLFPSNKNYTQVLPVSCLLLLYLLDSSFFAIKSIWCWLWEFSMASLPLYMKSNYRRKKCTLLLLWNWCCDWCFSFTGKTLRNCNTKSALITLWISYERL